MNRHHSRVKTMQLIYEWHFKTNLSLNTLARKRLKSQKDEKIDQIFILENLKGIEKNIEKIDKLIEKAAPEWPIEQIALIDLSILRLSVYELLFKKDIPPKVAIDEAVELAKTYGSDNSSKFVNGVLGTIFRSSDRYDPKRDE